MFSSSQRSPYFNRHKTEPVLQMQMRMTDSPAYTLHNAALLNTYQPHSKI